MAGKGRFLGVDIGSKRTGLARTDLLNMFASPVGTFPYSDIFDEIKKQVEEEGPVRGIVVGWPLTPQGSPTDATSLAEAFIKKCKADFPDIPVHRMDERYSSREAGRILAKSGVPKKKRQQKGRLDQAAAAWILQQFLDSNPDL